MKEITIFSTKTTDEDGCLFANTKQNEHNKIFYKYFRSSIAELMKYVLKDQTKMEEVRDMLFSVVDANKPLTSIDKDIVEKLRKKGKSKELTRIFEDNIKAELNSAHDNDTFRDLLCERITSWNLRDEYEAIVGGDVAEIKDAKEKSTLYKIGDLDIFAIRSLKGRDRDTGKSKWISTLMEFVNSLTNGQGLVLNLILHDKDFGENTVYTKSDVTFLAKEDVDALLGSFAIPNTQCNIVFFQHTTNAWVKILRTPYSPKRDLVKEINDALSSYRELGILNKMSIANNANNQVEFDELRNTFLADFPICNVGCYDTIVKLDERRKIILDKLYNDYKG